MCWISLSRTVQCSRIHMYARPGPQRVLLRRCVAIIQSLFASFGSEIAHIVGLRRFESQISHRRVSVTWGKD